MAVRVRVRVRVRVAAHKPKYGFLRRARALPARCRFYCALSAAVAPHSDRPHATSDGAVGGARPRRVCAIELGAQKRAGSDRGAQRTCKSCTTC